MNFTRLQDEEDLSSRDKSETTDEEAAIDSQEAEAADTNKSDILLNEHPSGPTRNALIAHCRDNLAIYLPVGFAIVVSLLIIVIALQMDSETDPKDTDPCFACFQGEPDECGFIPVSLYPFSKKQAVRRNDRLQYNGNPGAKIYESGVTLEIVFRAIYGDVTARKESVLYRWVRYAVSNRSTKYYETFGFKEYFKVIPSLVDFAWDYLETKGYERTTPSNTNDNHNDNNNNTVSEVSALDAMCATEYAMNAFWGNLTNHQIEILNLLYNLPKYGFDNHGGYSVWTTIYQQLAPSYGPIVVVFKPEVSSNGAFLDGKPRTIDLNIWNLEHNNSYIFPPTEWEDTGEFSAPGWRSYREFYGVILHPTPSPPISFHNPLIYFPVLFSFFKIEYQKATYILVLDGHLMNGSLSYCVDQGKDGYFYQCIFPTFELGNPFLPYPTLLPERCRAIGFISACPPNNILGCQPPKGLFDKYMPLTSPYTIPQELVEYIDETQWRDPLNQKEFTLRFYPLNSTAIVDPDIQIPVLERFE